MTRGRHRFCVGVHVVGVFGPETGIRLFVGGGEGGGGGGGGGMGGGAGGVGGGGWDPGRC